MWQGRTARWGARSAPRRPRSCAGTPRPLDAGAVAAAAAYREVTAAELPWLIEELDGVAEGAGADPLAVFAASIEEIADAEPAPAARCSDLVATAPATPDGHVWVAHNNDLGPESEDELVALEWRVPGEPVSFTIGDRAVDQRRLQLGRPGAHRERALAERRPGRHPAPAAGARHPAPADARRGGRGGPPPAPGVVVQQPPEPPRRRCRERRGLGHRRRAPAARTTAARWPTRTTTRARGWPRTSAIPRRSRARHARQRSACAWLDRGPVDAAAPARRALRPHRRAGLALPPRRARRAVEDCLLVPCRRHRRDDPLRSRKPVRLPGAALRLQLRPPHTAMRS